MFKPGDKVVCVDDSPVRPDCAVGMPLRLMLRAVYTVASIQQEPHIPGYGVRLEEMPNPSILWSDGEEREWSYDARRFRYAVEPKQRDALASAERPKEGVSRDV